MYEVYETIKTMKDIKIFAKEKKKRYTRRWCTSPWHLASGKTKFFITAPNICWSWHWDFLRHFEGQSFEAFSNFFLWKCCNSAQGCFRVHWGLFSLTHKVFWRFGQMRGLKEMSHSFENFELVDADGLKEAILQNAGWFWLIALRIKCQQNTAWVSGLAVKHRWWIFKVEERMGFP